MPNRCAGEPSQVHNVSTLIPARPKLYHIVHVDRLPSIIHAGGLVSDVAATEASFPGTNIGITEIKERRRTRRLRSHPNLRVGECVPFYFCTRSVMLYVIAESSAPELGYRGGQDPIIHLQADLHATVAWAERERHRWAFTNRNAGTRYFDDFADIRNLDRIQWDAMSKQPWQTDDWPSTKDAKQAEFLLERFFPWSLIERIGCRTVETRTQVTALVRHTKHRPPVLLVRDWYHNL